MMNHRQTYKNAALTVLQVAVSASFLFAVYKYLLTALGPAKLGIWSVVMALSTVARITDLGFAGGMTRFVAKYRALEQPEAVEEIIQTGALSLATLLGFMLLAAYPLVDLALPWLFDTTAIGDARQLLPYSMASFCLLAIAGVFLSSLDGMQRADLRNIILIIGTVLYGVLVPIFVSSRGFVGLGYAQLGQTSFILIASWVVTKHQARITSWLPLHWRMSRFREMLSYNLHLQFSTVASFLGDPLAKVMLGQFGTLAMVGYYEMASKMIAQFRAVVVNVNQVLVPVIAHMNEKDSASVKSLYQKTYSVLLVVSVTFYGSALVCVPLISELWIGERNIYFEATAWVMLAAMQVNTMTGPAFFSNMGVGKVAINSLAQVVIGAVNIALGLLFGNLFGGPGIVLAYGAAITLGSVFLLGNFLMRENIPASSLLPADLRRHVFTVILVGLSTTVASLNLHDPSWVHRYLPPSVGAALILLSVCLTPHFQQLLMRVWRIRGGASKGEIS